MNPYYKIQGPRWSSIVGKCEEMECLVGTSEEVEFVVGTCEEMEWGVGAFRRYSL